VVTTQTNGFAIASLVLGIVGFFLNPLSVLAVIFGAIALSQSGKNPDFKGKGMAVAGLVMGIIVIVFWVVIIIVLGSLFWWYSV
jgi:hypothetical protein